MEEQQQKTNKELYRDVYRQACQLFNDSQGVLLVFLVICFGLRAFVLFPLFSKVWSLTLSTLPQQFVTDGNVMVLVTHPYALVVGLLIAIAAVLAFTWEINGVLLLLESRRQGCPIGMFRVMGLSIGRTLRIIRPRNTLFFIFILVTLPCVDLHSSSGMLLTFSIPEYIADYILASPVLSILFLVVVVALVVVVIRLFYCIQGVLIQGDSFRMAAHNSNAMMKGRAFRQIVELVRYVILRALRLCVPPAIVAVLVIAVVASLLYSCADMLPSTIALIMPGFIGFFTSISIIYIRMAVMCYMVTDYRVFADAQGINAAPQLPEVAHKHYRTWSLHALRPLVYGVLIVGSAFLIAIGTVVSVDDPEFMELFTSNTKIAAHKGYSSEAPENTMDAFEAAFNSKYVDMIELDVRESKDGVPIVIHDASLKSACGVNAQVYDLDYEEIRSYNACYGFTEEEFPNAYVPTLEEVLEKYGGKVELLIEIKADDRTPDLPQKIVDLMNKYGCKDSCMIHSGSYEALEAVKAIDDTIPCGYIIAFAFGSYFSLPCADFFSVEHDFVDLDVLAKAHLLGKKVYAWTVNEASSIDAMAGLDVDCVITDDPDAVHEDGYSSNDVVSDYLERLQSDLQGNNSDGSEAYDNEDY